MTTYLATVWRFRYFWMSLVRMDLRTRYRRSLLGVGWSLMQPLAMTAIFCLVFPFFMHVSVREYVPHALTGLVCWSFVVGCAVAGCHTFIISEAYIRQCPLPLAIYPLRTSLGALFHLAMGMGVLTVVCTVMRGFPGVGPLLSLVPTLALMFVFGWAMAALSGTFNVFFQDTQHLAEVGFQILFYLTPIIYRLSDLPRHRLSWLLQWNPLVAFLNLVRAPLLDGAVPTPGQYLHAAAIAAALAAVAAAVLGRMQKRLIFYL
ncbi:MAG TPA: ABC transporter permease [Gemmataceae bacterium]|jgi:ABC-type polysaccharide/polyol phosphate export permease